MMTLNLNQDTPKANKNSTIRTKPTPFNQGDMTKRTIGTFNACISRHFCIILSIYRMITPIKFDEETRARLTRVREKLKIPISQIIKLSLLKENINLDYYEKLANHDYTDHKENV